jgi:formylglycine-generating enzyme required for sulfatase activity
MLEIPAGPFVMGDDSGATSERPAHTVHLERFCIDRFPVMNQAYAVFVQETGQRPPPNWRNGRPEHARVRHPVVDLSWHDAVSYATWAGKRLPTEAEWEKAASWDEATQHKRRWPWGDRWHAGRANAGPGVIGVFLHHRTTDVGHRSPEGDSPYGVADMAGNVWEWCSSLYLPYPYIADSERENPYASGNRVLRGGAWSSAPDQCRTTYRMALPPGHVLEGICGFRCAK